MMIDVADFTNTLLAASFIRVNTRSLGLINPHTQHIYEKQGFEGSIEITSHPSFPTTWAHRTEKSAAGTGVRPEGGSSLKKLIKHLR